ncbi:hypothetical protein R1sor_018751 [Riccia sorocarpa]|uniref:Uncharacterized protein n=1 Tax=Riccia sorocarpa TaxID=122646 RepID=A0ABD3IGT4_9MARC
MDTVGESVTSRPEEVTQEKEMSECAGNSFRTTGSLAFNLERYLLDSSPQVNFESRTKGARTPQSLQGTPQSRAETPKSRSSSIAKRGILRSPLAKGIALNLFGTSGESGESEERLRAQEDSIFIQHSGEGVHFPDPQQVEGVSEPVIRTTFLAMSEEGQSSQGGPNPVGSNSGEREEDTSTFWDVGTGTQEPAQSPKSAGVLYRRRGDVNGMSAWSLLCNFFCPLVPVL